MKSGNLNFLEPSGPLQACNGFYLQDRIQHNKCNTVQLFKADVRSPFWTTVQRSAASPSHSLLCTFTVTDGCLHILSNLCAAFRISNTLVCYTESKFNVVQHFLNLLQITIHNTFTSINILSHLWPLQLVERRSQWPRGLRHRSTATPPLRLRVRIPAGPRMFVRCECCVLSGRGLCNGLITHPEKSYQMWQVIVCDQETSNQEAKARYGAVENTIKRVVTPRKQTNETACGSRTLTCP
jgi:hypothetical protein